MSLRQAAIVALRFTGKGEIIILKQSREGIENWEHFKNNSLEICRQAKRM